MSRRIRRDYSSSIRFAYLDTNFYSFLKHDDVRLRAISYFNDKALIVLVTVPHWAELHEANRQHALVSRFWDDIGAMIVAPPMLEAYQDLDAYPSVDRRRLPRILGPISDDAVRGFLGGNPVDGSPTGYSASVLSESLNQAKAQPRSREFINEVKSLSDPSSRTNFEDRWIIHYLLQNAKTRSHPNFIKLCPPLVPGSFPSLRGQAAMVWWAQVRIPTAGRSLLSDLGDQMHSLNFCHCDMIVLEKRQREVLRQLQQSAPNLFKPSLATVATRNFVQMLRGEVADS